MNLVDLNVLAVLGVSALLGFLRGFLRELLGLCAWAGAVFLAVRLTPFCLPEMVHLLGPTGLAEPVSFALLFVVSLILLSLLAGLAARGFRATGIGGLDRSVGVLFGVLRGAALVAAAYMLVGLVFPPRTWPAPVLRARAIGFAYQGARALASVLPARYAPEIDAPPSVPVGQAALLQAAPSGSALAHPPSTGQGAGP